MMPASRVRKPAMCSSGKLFEQRFRLLQIRRVEALGEPSVDLGQHTARFLLLALLLQKTTQACHRAELERLRALAAGDVDGVAKGSLGFRWSLGHEQKLSLEAVCLRFPVAFAAFFHRVESFRDESERFARPPLVVSRCKQAKRIR